MKKSILTIAALLLTAVSFTLSAHAQETTNEKAPPYTDVFRVVSQTDLNVDTPSYDPDAATHPAIKLTPDKSMLINLDDTPTTVIVGNPAHLSILPNAAQDLLLVGKQPGATHFIALNHENKIIMQRHVIVAAPKHNYVRVRKTCAASGDDKCQAMQVYYCPDACYETAIAPPDAPQEATSTIDTNLNTAPAQFTPPPPVDTPDK